MSGEMPSWLTPGQQLGRLAAHARPVEEPAPAALVAEEDVRRPPTGRRPGRAPGRSWRRRGRSRPTGSPTGEQLAVERISPAVGSTSAGDALDQRRLAGAVRADDAVHLAGPHVEVDAAEGADAGVLLDQTADLEDVGRLRHGRAHQATISGRRVRWAISQPDLDLLLGAAPDRVLVLDRQHAVEAALVEGVDQTRQSTWPRPGTR